MKEEVLYDILRYPVISEKSTMMSTQRKYVFKVQLCATKSKVKTAVEKIFGVKVEKVNTNRTQGKTKYFKGTKGMQSDYKKAIVTLAENNEIDLSVGVK